MLLPIETKPFSIAELHCSNIISYWLSITTFTIYHQHVQQHLIISDFHAILETINHKAPDCHGADPPARPTSMRKSVLAGWGLAPFKGLRNEMTRHGGHGLWMSIFPRLGHFHEKTLWWMIWCMMHPFTVHEHAHKAADTQLFTLILKQFSIYVECTKAYLYFSIILFPFSFWYADVTQVFGRLTTQGPVVKRRRQHQIRRSVLANLKLLNIQVERNCHQLGV